WLVTVVAWFRRSSVVLIGGLLILGIYTAAALYLRWVTTTELGLRISVSWPLTIGFAALGLLIMLAWSPVADHLAGRWFEEPPTLESFHAIQESRGKLIAGIVVAWVLGGFLEELVARGIVLISIRSLLGTWLPQWAATVFAVCIAAIGAGLIHLYQGPKAVVVVAQLSVLFGLLFVMSGYNLWAVMLCHGLYDTIAFVRFATGRSRYSRPSGVRE
ncbi:MAG: lysostaphin resistance A-like protein, partial [Bacteroidota bacterium]